jgi:hypothetical protein
LAGWYLCVQATQATGVPRSSLKKVIYKISDTQFAFYYSSLKSNSSFEYSFAAQRCNFPSGPRLDWNHRITTLRSESDFGISTGLSPRSVSVQSGAAEASSQKQRFRTATLKAKMNWKHRTTILIHLVLTSVSTKGGYSKRRKGSWILVHFVISETCSKLEAAPLRRFLLDRSRKQHQATQPLLPCINLGRKENKHAWGTRHLRQDWMMPKIPDLPPELWDVVVSHLSPLSGSAAAEAFRFERTTERRSHASIWQAFFKKESWAAIVTSDFANQLILLGTDLLKLYDDYRRAI